MAGDCSVSNSDRRRARSSTAAYRRRPRPRSCSWQRARTSRAARTASFAMEKETEHADRIEFDTDRPRPLAFPAGHRGEETNAVGAVAEARPRIDAGVASAERPCDHLS